MPRHASNPQVQNLAASPAGSFGLGPDPSFPKRRAAFATAALAGRRRTSQDLSPSRDSDKSVETTSSSDGMGPRHRFDSGLILLLIVAIVYLGGYFTLFAVRQREVSAFTADDDPRS